MASIANRYVLRETAQTWVVVTLVLLAILLTNQFAQVLGDAAANRLPRQALLLVMYLTSLQYLTILIPVGLFLSILLALGRLYRDSEMYALMACGIGPAQLYRPLLGFAAVLAALVGWLALEITPWAVREVKEIAQQARMRADLSVMEAGRFVSFGQAEAVVYAQEVAGGRLHNVFVQRRSGKAVEIVVAEEAWQQPTADPDVRMLTFARGRRYEGDPGSMRFRVVSFAEHGVPYSLPFSSAPNLDPEARPLAELAASEDPHDVAELQARVSVPLMVLVLALLAVPLGRSSPRQGRYAGLAVGVLVFSNYLILLGVARVWVERARVPEFIGMWWVHALFAAAAVLLLGFRYGGWRLPSRRGRGVAR
jgi:lipopolysaccharide export system permease protein